MAEIILTGRSSFLDLGEAKRYQDNPKNEPRRSATILIPQGDAQCKAVEKAILEALKAKFPNKDAAKLYAVIKDNSNKCCWQNGDKKEYDGYAGMMALSAHRYLKKGRPIVWDMDGQPVYKDNDDFNDGKAGRMYNGCKIKMKVDIFAYDNSGIGVAAELKVVQRVGGGDAFGGGTPPNAEGFEAVEEGADDSDDMS